MYTRAGAFNFDSLGQLVTPDGSLVQGWAADTSGAVDVNGPLTTLQLPIATLMGAAPSTRADFAGNLPADAAVGTVLNRSIEVFDDLGNAQQLTVGFTRTGTGWTAAATVGGVTEMRDLAFDGKGALVPLAQPFTVGGLELGLGTVTGYAGITSVEAATQNGREAGSLQSFSLNADGTLMGSFSNGLKQAIGQVALASFTNPAGLSKAGSSLYRTSANSGEPAIGTAGTGGRGSLAGGALEMSNVDLSSEFTNLIIAQRGFQANSRVITTSDELLQELVNLKR
jgi:flagellar hook protein FlgE